MIRFVESDQIDQQKWDQLIFESQYPTIFASFNFLNISSHKWGAIIAHDYEWVIPLPYRNKCGVNYVYTPPFISRLGFFSRDEIPQKEITAAFDHIPKKFCLVELGLNRLCPPSLGREAQSFELHLNQDYQNIYSNYSDNTKRILKSAAKKQLMLVQTVEIEDIISLFKNNRGKKIDHSIPEAHYQILIKLVQCASKSGNIEKWGVWDQNHQLIAGAIFLNDQNRKWFWFSGRDDSKSDSKAMFLIIDHMIKINQNSELILDFNGSNNPNIARFYAGFGATSYIYPYLMKYHPILQPFIKCYKMMKK